VVWLGATGRLNEETASGAGFGEWARLGSNQRPLACEARLLLVPEEASKPVVERDWPTRRALRIAAG